MKRGRKRERNKGVEKRKLTEPRGSPFVLLGPLVLKGCLLLTPTQLRSTLRDSVPASGPGQDLQA